VQQQGQAFPLLIGQRRGTVHDPADVGGKVGLVKVAAGLVDSLGVGTAAGKRGQAGAFGSG
jgi:hypothetical protein